jgi:hypothetical protein
MSVSNIGSSSSGNSFSISVSSTYSTVILTNQQPAGAYSFTSINNNNTMDLYFYNATGSLVASTNGKSINTSIGFSKLVIIGGSVGDVITFTNQTTYNGTAETAETTAGPVILSTNPTSLPNINSTTTITGLNFASNIIATFTGTDNLTRNAKSLVYGSPTSIIITRPDSMPVTYSPYTLAVTNPGVTPPTGSTKNQISVTAGVNPVWITSSSQFFLSGSPCTLTLSATDADSGSSITYSSISGSLPTGLSFNSSTGVISGTPTATGTFSYTVRATDSGGNYSDLALSIVSYVISGGTLTSDTTYYYRTFTSNGSLNIAGVNLTADILVVAGGGGGGGGEGTNGAGGGGAGGGAGGLVYLPSQTISIGTTAITVGSGSAGRISPYSSDSTNPAQGSPSQFGLLQQAYGGGPGTSEQNTAPSGTYGSGGGAGGDGGGAGSSATAGQGYAGGSSGNRSGGGGGGAGGAGANWVSGGGTSGGSGSNTYSTWLTAISSAMSGVSGWSTATSGGYIAGGGGGGNGNGQTSAGGAGGAGGGGAGSAAQSAGVGGGGLSGTAGTTNTGSGGGGDGAGNYNGSTVGGGNGGSGLVVIRYTRASVGG